MRYIPLVASVLMLLSATTGRCQDPMVIKIRGIVRDAASGEPIPYASIGLTGKAIATMTNEKGQFLFRIPAAAKDDSLSVTHIGFTPIILPVRTADTGERKIELKESPGQLKEVEVKPPNPLELIRKAIEKIPANYPDSPFCLTGFYRLDGTKDAKIVDLSEAVFNIHIDGYRGKNNQFHLVKSRMDKDLTAFNGSDQVNVGYKPSGIMSFDFSRHLDKWELFQKEAAKEYLFKYKGLVDYNGKDAFLITFEEKPGVKKSLTDGRLYIEADDLAFLELDQKRNLQGLKYYDEWSRLEHLVFNMFHISIKVLSDTTSITYRKNGSRYYLSHCTKSIDYYIAGGDRHYLLNPLSVRTNYLITGVDTVNVQPIPGEESLKEQTSIEGQAKILNDTRDSPDRSDTADRFWTNYNLIEAEFNVDSAIRVIQSNNATLNYKKLLEPLLRKYKRDKGALIDTIMNFYHTKGQFNGSALVQYEGKVIYEKGFGLADPAVNRPNTTATQFRIGSTSKQFTAMLVMQLVNEGKLSVDDSAGKFLPGFRNGKVTIRQLMTHQSGIPNYTDSEEVLAKIVARRYTPDELVFLFCSDSLEFEPGTRFHYTNSGFVVLADIIEKVTGKKYAQALAERIFVPLGMSSSFFVSGDTTNIAKAYSGGQPENPYPVQNVVGAGGITSSAEDLLRWANALSANTLLPKQMMDELFKPRAAWDEWNAWYGYGWMIDRHLFAASNRHLIQYHPGIEFGFHDILLREPDKNVVIILLSNMGDFPRFDMTDLILNELN
ncbi:MAG TPA: serine hydrolase [Puia sp.]|uniref:serine hydrolase n=1 Tax=Puia sp. TaxID=2045100 RepID=UPI002CE613EA|nr:serine hydrolase [Puia sp.]HVU97073.1 serine hydrolase [Puia sp.]